MNEQEREAAYAWWRQALAEVAAGRVPELPSRDVQAGFWRTRKGEPVATWLDDCGDMVGRVGANGRVVDVDDAWADRVFSSACRQPVAEEAYRAACEGKPWPDVDPAVHAMPSPQLGGFGHNSGAASPAEAFADEVETACAGAGAYAEISDDVTAGRAQSLRSRLGEILKVGRDRRDEDEKPLKEAYDACHAAWMAPLNKVTDTGKAIREALTAWENRKLKAERDAREAAVKANPETAKVVQATTAPVKRQVKGGYGRAANVKTIQTAIIVDQDAAYAALRDNPVAKNDIAAVILKHAQKVISAGGTVAGVRAEEARKVA